MSTETKKTPIDANEEKQEQNVTVKLGKTHFEALRRWSKKQFGVENRAGFIRWLIHERMESETGPEGK